MDFAHAFAVEEQIAGEGDDVAEVVRTVLADLLHGEVPGFWMPHEDERASCGAGRRAGRTPALAAEPPTMAVASATAMMGLLRISCSFLWFVSEVGSTLCGGPRCVAVPRVESGRSLD